MAVSTEALAMAGANYVECNIKLDDQSPPPLHLLAEHLKIDMKNLEHFPNFFLCKHHKMCSFCGGMHPKNDDDYVSKNDDYGAKSNDHGVKIRIGYIEEDDGVESIEREKKTIKRRLRSMGTSMMRAIRKFLTIIRAAVTKKKRLNQHDTMLLA